MGLRKLLRQIRENKRYRKLYRIKPTVSIHVDTDRYIFVFIPTILYAPWVRRIPGSCIVGIAWLNFHIYIGEWVEKR